MSIIRHSLSVISFVALIHLSGHAYAFGLPENNIPTSHDPACWTVSNQIQFDRLMKEMESVDGDSEREKREIVRQIGKYATPKKIHIDVKVIQEKPGDKIKLDASGSTVPSGNIGYNWNKKGPDQVIIEVAPGSSRTYYQQSVQIIDKTCGIYNATMINVHSK
ncbi:hypothetical protein [Photorhabdus hindustanensis]|uniref:Uncharacterized protein n=1 Tax=Photorhabdus hindustanensis TaxID=2918802 RepID=A0A2S8PVV4_9GAMM|nr:hypothetical protein [Photorhabdus hindustanensis]PQQ23060.1 hypothetical protein C6H66_20815 [Photorhabdus hindustanensis]